MKKIFVDKNDEVVKIIEKVIASSDRHLVLVIPRFSKLASSLSNFHSLKKQAQENNKTIFIESVDEEILALAHAVQLEALNPLLGASRRSLSDIVVTSNHSTKKTLLEKKPETTPAPREVEVEVSDLNNESDEISSDDEVKPLPHQIHKPVIDQSDDEDTPRQNFNFASFFKKVLMFAVIIAISAGVAWAAVFYLPSAEVKIVTKKTPWDFNGNLVADTSLSSVAFEKGLVPAQFFDEKKNLQQSFPASGKKYLEEKAHGMILIYNVYSSSPQSLVASTRFETSDKKTFRLAKSVIVPGAKIENGKIIPSSIEAELIADKAGDTYNVSAPSRLKIPGFSGTPKYDGFYGELKVSFAGGFVGEMAYPTSDDIAKAKEVVAKSLEDNLKAVFYTKVPNEFKIIDGATNFNLIKSDVVTIPDKSGNFAISASAELRTIAFRESDVLTLITQMAQKDLSGDFRSKDFTLDYSSATPDFKAMKLTIPVKFHGIFSKYIDEADFKQQIVGKTDTEVKSMLYSLPGMGKASASFWPFWVNRVPDDLSKVKVNIE